MQLGTTWHNVIQPEEIWHNSTYSAMHTVCACFKTKTNQIIILELKTNTNQTNIFFWTQNQRGKKQSKIWLVFLTEQTLPSSYGGGQKKAQPSGDWYAEMAGVSDPYLVIKFIF
jgi:hypothetical protein